jgi:formamidopyrimidine-DNA glycosylase
MPELPEVETVRQTLNRLILGKEILSVDVFLPRIVRNVSVTDFKRHLSKQKIKSINRKGKYLIFNLTNVNLLVHLRMEGKFFIKNSSVKATRHEHIIFYLNDGSSLRYHDTRTFGTMDLFFDEQIPLLSKLGPEPCSDNLTATYLYKQLQKKKQMIKPALLDQSVIAGLGNIYVDEVLFLSRMHPKTRCNELTVKDCEVIVESICSIIQKAIKFGGSTIRSYSSSLGVSGKFQNELMVHTRNGENCYECAKEIIKIKVGGRGTYLCPVCQKTKRRKKPPTKLTKS